MTTYHHKCPKCGTVDVRISAEVTVQPIEKGCEVTGDITWNGDSFIACQADECGHTGIVEEFECDPFEVEA